MVTCRIFRDVTTVAIVNTDDVDGENDNNSILMLMINKIIKIITFKDMIYDRQ